MFFQATFILYDLSHRTQWHTSGKKQERRKPLAQAEKNGIIWEFRFGKRRQSRGLASLMMNFHFALDRNVCFEETYDC
jgi:hypothetical protein